MTNTESSAIEEIVEIIQCPICYLAMTPPLRTPMIFHECGHTICQQCVSKIKECPLCNQLFSTPSKNILIYQISDALQKKGLIPIDLNPPPASENKLIQKIDPLCTFSATGSMPIWQKSYECKTCHTAGFCEICANNCHQNHEISLIKDGPGVFCRCGMNSKNCHCCPKTQNVKCTAEMTNGTTVDQPMYQCIDCRISGDNYVCQHCAMKCHYQHKLRYIGILKNKKCSCYENNTCQIAERKQVCTYFFHGQTFIRQPWYHCHTCGLTNDKGCCAACAKICHKGHNVEFTGIHDSCYCDCGDGACSCSCQTCKFPNSNYMLCCTKIDKNKKLEPKKQRMYQCLTCGITDSFGVCEACAINCHINHSLSYAGEKNFVCICNDMCKMEMIPTLHNERKICDRKVLNDDDVSACYTCLTCDPSGKKQICETCALKLHEKHDIHLVGYTIFKCCEGGKF